SVGIPDLAVAENGDVAICDQSYSAKYAGTDGHLVWDRVPDTRFTSLDYSPDVSGLHQIAIDFSGNVMLMEIDEGNLLKCASSNGAVIWKAPLPSTPAGLAMDDMGNVLIAGSTNFSGNVLG